ncbi:MAG TPA: outer membrane beta-barrel protein [Vicinamibacteria bacterium]|nr:outer membrane beta-barrel protein [Vicinamibacteria bacterium]
MRVALCALAALGLAASASAAEPEVRAVRATTLDFRVALRVLTSPDAPPGEVLREGGEIVIRVPGVAPEALALPALEKPLGAIRLVREPGLTILRVEAAPEVPFEASHEPGMLTVVFGEQPAPELRGPVTPELYERLFPTGGQGTGAPETEEPGFEPAGGEGIALGRVTLRPYVTVSWVDADVLAFENPVPVRDHYLQVAPGVTASVPLIDGVLAAEYEPRFRFFSDIPLVNETSHFAGARYEVPIGSRVFLRLGQRYTRAILETTVVDPGREYFYNLSQYTFWATTAAARVELGPRLFGEAQAAWVWTRFDQAQPGGFFDFDSRTLRAGLGYDVGSDLRATVSYAYERIPPSPDRAIVETTAHSLIGTLAGTVASLTTGSLSVGYRSQTNPLATAESASFRGFTLGGSLRRELGHSSSVELQFTRAVDPSSFDTNAYYTNNSLVASLSVPVPFELWARGSVGFLRNNYPNDAPGLGVPRRDDILGWTVGLGRQLGWRTWVRADYRRERRDSNLPGYDVTTDGFVVQLGVGLFGPGFSRP